MITDIELAYHAEGWAEEDFVSALRAISGAGFRGVEVVPEIVRSFHDRVLVFREMLADIDLHLSAVEAVMESLNEENIEEAGLALLRYASFAEQMGAPVLIVRPPYREKRTVESDEHKVFFGFISEIGKEILKRGVKLAVRPDVNTIIEKRTEMTALMKATPKKSVFLCPDTSHLMTVKVSVETVLKQYKKRIGYVRMLDGRPRAVLKNEWRRRSPTWRPLGKGKVNVKQIIRTLDKIGFEGWVCASHPPPVKSADKACERAMDSLEKALDTLS